MLSPLPGKYPVIGSPIVLTHEYQTHVDKLEAENWMLRRMLTGKDAEIGNFLASKDIQREVLQNMTNANAQIERLTEQLKLAELTEQRLRQQIAAFDNSGRNEMVEVAEEATLLDSSAEATLENTALRARVEKLETENGDLQRELKEITESTEQMLQEYESMKQNIEELTSKCEKAEKDLEDAISAHEIEKQDLEQELQKLKAENEQLKLNVQDEEEDNIPKIEELANILEKANQENDKLATENEQLKREIDELRTKSGNNNEEVDIPNVEELADILERANQENDRLMLEIESLKQAKGDNDDLLAKLERLDELLSQANEQKQEATDELNMILNLVGCDDVDAAMTQFETLQHVVDDLKAQNEEIGKQNDELRAHLQKTPNDIDDLKEQITAYTEQVVVLKTENERLKNELKEASKSNRRSIQTSPLSKNSEIESLKLKLKETEMELQNAKEEAESIKNKLRETHSTGSKQEASEILITGSIIDSDDEIEKLRSENDTLRDQVKRLSKQKDDIERLQAENEQLQDQITNLRKSLLSPGSQRRKDTEIARIMQELADLKAENAELQRNTASTELSVLRQENETLKKSVGRLESENAKLKASLSKIQRLCIQRSQSMALKFTAFARNVSNAVLKASRSVASISERLPVLITQHNVYPLQRLRKDLVAFIAATRDMMQDLHDGANACIRATSSKFRRGKRIYVPLTRDEKRDLVTLEKKYQLGSLINSVGDDAETEITDGMTFSPIPSKSERFRLKNTHYERVSELVRAQDEITFLATQLRLLLATITRGEAPDVAALASVRDHTAIKSLVATAAASLQSLPSRTIGPRVVALIESVRRDVGSRAAALSDEHRALMARLNC